MRKNYTEQANDRFLDLMDQGLYHIWDDIENTPEDTSADKWRKKILGIAHEYNLSSRFALMRILYCRRTGFHDLPTCSPGEGVSFSMKIRDKMVEFSDVSIQHAKQLTNDELAQYKDALLEEAAAQKYPDYDEAVAQELISEGIQACDNPLKGTILSRKKAFALGHVLGFSASEMQWFLLRVFQTADGFGHKSSSDLIDYYCFETKKNYTSALKLKQEYARRTEAMETEEAGAYSPDWTQKLGETFSEKIKDWNTKGAQADELFLQWLVEHARFLDRPSRTSLRVYRNLALYAFHIAIGQEDVPEESRILDRMKAEIERQDYGELQNLLQSEGERIHKLGDRIRDGSDLMELFRDTILNLEPDELLGVINSQPGLKEHFEKLFNNLTPDKRRDAINDEKKELFKKLFRDLSSETLCDVIARILTPEMLCDVIANTLTMENSLLTYTNVPDKYRAKAWGGLSVNSRKKPSRSQSELKDVFLGKTPPQKSDVLYLVWYLLNRSWTEHVSTELIPEEWEDILSPGEIFNRMADFIEISEYALDMALLPAFYPPHLMEQSMMLAIATSRNNARRIPAQTYEAICTALIAPRKKTAAPHKEPTEPLEKPDEPRKKKNSDPHAKPLTKKEREKTRFAVVEDYLQNQETQTLKVCAEKYGISVQTLINWKSKYLKAQGK